MTTLATCGGGAQSIQKLTMMKLVVVVITASPKLPLKNERERKMNLIAMKRTSVSK
jgi:hypothetical protein